MNAEPLLAQVAALLHKRRLSAVLIGNAAAALQGSPVTTMDLDFMSRIDGVRSFEALRARASRVEFRGATLLVADLRDIIRSKEAADRPEDRAVLPVIRRTLDEREKG
jgi:hypothetical protein